MICFVEYTVQKLAKLAGVSGRTLRYYDEIGLLKPKRINSSGYRIYGAEQVDRLQQILLFRELDMGLDEIERVLSSPGFDGVAALKTHKQNLAKRQKRLEELIENVDRTIAAKERGIPMTDQQKFEGFKKELIEENERNYGREIREKYGEESVEDSNRKLMGMSQGEYEKMERLSQEVLDVLKQAFDTGDASGELAQKAAALHKDWLCFHWKDYSPEAHANLAQMYVDDARFSAYYDKDQPGMAAFLRDAVQIYTKQG